LSEFDVRPLFSEVADELDVVTVAVGARDAQAGTARTTADARLDGLRRLDAQFDETLGQQLGRSTARDELVTRQITVAERRSARHDVHFGRTGVVYRHVFGFQRRQLFDVRRVTVRQ